MIFALTVAFKRTPAEEYTLYKKFIHATNEDDAVKEVRRYAASLCDNPATIQLEVRDHLTLEEKITVDKI